MDQQEQEIQLDVYFQGGRDQIYALLYPIAGINSPIFDHLELQNAVYKKEEKQIQFTYETKDFSNIDRQKQPIKYSSTSLPSKSNYFYSYHTPQGLVWRNITKILQMRPTPIKCEQKNQKKNEQIKQKINQQEIVIENKTVQKDQKQIQLYKIQVNDQDNKIMRQIMSVPDRYLRNQNNLAKRNWDMNQKQYFMRVFE